MNIFIISGSHVFYSSAKLDTKLDANANADTKLWPNLGPVENSKPLGTTIWNTIGCAEPGAERHTYTNLEPQLWPKLGPIDHIKTVWAAILGTLAAAELGTKLRTHSNGESELWPELVAI